MFDCPRRGGYQADAAQVDHHLRQRSTSTPIFCDLSFGGRALQSGCQFARGRFHLFVTPAQIARGPIQLA